MANHSFLSRETLLSKLAYCNNEDNDNAHLVKLADEPNWLVAIETGSAVGYPGPARQNRGRRSDHRKACPGMVLWGNRAARRLGKSNIYGLTSVPVNSRCAFEKSGST